MMDTPRNQRDLVVVVPAPGPAAERPGEALVAALDALDGITSWRLAPEPGGADLVLHAAADAVVLPSTLARLVHALDAGGGAVAAREVSVGGARAEPLVRLAAAGVAAPARVVPGAIAARLADGPAPPADVPGGAPLLATAVRILGLGEAADAVTNVLAPAPAGDPLLSIVVRTQLRRSEALRDVLLCLAVQRDARFEVLLVVHDAPTDPVERLLAEQPAWLRARVRVLAATGGTRSRPLNTGFAAARGSHVAVLDDDDLVSGDWVAAFLAATSANPGRVLRAVVGVQSVVATTWEDGVEGHADVGPVTRPYPPVFDLADHLRINLTPFMAFAFPRAVLEHLGGADEELEVCEDWDLILRATSLVGVADIAEHTAVYRRWTSGGDSYTLHDADVWERDMARVRAKLDAVPLVLPPGSASALASLSATRAEESVLGAVYASTSWRVTAPLRAVSRLAGRLRAGGDRA